MVGERVGEPRHLGARSLGLGRRSVARGRSLRRLGGLRRLGVAQLRGDSLAPRALLPQRLLELATMRPFLLGSRRAARS
jgi:hypothetical protein